MEPIRTLSWVKASWVSDSSATRKSGLLNGNMARQDNYWVREAYPKTWRLTGSAAPPSQWPPRRYEDPSRLVPWSAGSPSQWPVRLATAPSLLHAQPATPLATGFLNEGHASSTCLAAKLQVSIHNVIKLKVILWSMSYHEKGTQELLRITTTLGSGPLNDFAPGHPRRQPEEWP